MSPPPPSPDGTDAVDGTDGADVADGTDGAAAEGADARDAVARLYVASPAGFVAARKALAATLKAAGRAEDATAVLALRKPTAAAWAVNLLVAERPGDVAALAAVGDELRDAQERLDGAAMRELSGRRRTLVDELAAAAVALAATADKPPSAAVREQIAETLTAVVADPEVAAQVRSGRLVAAGEVAPGLGPLPEGDAASPATGVAGGTGTTPARGKGGARQAGTGQAGAGRTGKGGEAPARPDAATARRDARAEQVARARAELEEAAAQDRDATAALGEAEAEEAQARAEVDDLRERLRAAEQRLVGAQQRHGRATRLAQRARTVLDAARKRAAALTSREDDAGEEEAKP
ncbi:MAG: hypothetical protein U0Q15_09420 [Kineosporiaceae bacterium]